MMSAVNAKHGYLAVSFSFLGKQGDSSSHCSNKRPKGEVEDPNPAIIASRASTGTIKEVTLDTNPDLLSPFSTHTHHHKNDVRTFKLVILKGKSARYTLYKDFLSQCINNELVSKGLKIVFEPTLGNYGQIFSDNWNSKKISLWIYWRCSLIL